MERTSGNRWELILGKHFVVKAIGIALFVLGATAQRALAQSASLLNNVGYTDENGSSSSLSSTNSNPLVITGATGSISSSIDYLSFSGQTSTKEGPANSDGNSTLGGKSSSFGRAIDSLTFVGAPYPFTGTLVVTLTNVSASGTNAFGNNSAYADVTLVPGAGTAVHFEVLANEFYGSPTILSQNYCTACSYDPSTGRMVIPFTFYNSSGPYNLQLVASVTSNLGGNAGVSGSVTYFTLPCGVSISSASGASYPVQYIGTCQNNGGGNSSDGPMPPWALGALGVGLLGIASRRLKKAA